MKLTDKEAERFWAKVKRGLVDSCWPWTASRTTAGYGQFGVQGKILGAHRIAYFLYYGVWPDVARHTCDNSICCNPRHLIDGTDADNVHDMMERGRWRARGSGSPKPEVYEPVSDRPPMPATCGAKNATMGELHPQAVISDAGIRHIREVYASGKVSQYELAKKFGVSQVWVGQVVRGERRAAAGGSIAKRGRGRRSWIEANPAPNLTAI